MTCNCKGKTPNSVALRLQCAYVAAQASGVNDVTQAEQRDGFVALINAIYNDAVAVGITAEALDGSTKEDTNGVEERNAMLGQPISVIRGLRDNAMEKFVSTQTVGQLIQSDYKSHIIDAALKPYGLRLGMRTDDIRRWIQYGKQEDSPAQG